MMSGCGMTVLVNCHSLQTFCFAVVEGGQGVSFYSGQSLVQEIISSPWDRHDFIGCP